MKIGLKRKSLIQDQNKQYSSDNKKSFFLHWKKLSSIRLYENQFPFIIESPSRQKQQQRGKTSLPPFMIRGRIIRQGNQNFQFRKILGFSRRKIPIRQ